MKLHKKLITGLAFVLIITLAFPFQFVRADESPAIDASSTPAVEVVETTPEDTTSTTLPVLESTDIGSTTDDIASSTDDTTGSTTPEVQTRMSLAVPTTATSTPDPVTINLDIEDASSTLFKSSLTVTPCAPQDGDTATVNGYCAITQSDLPVTWQWFPGFGAAIVTIAGIDGFNSAPYWTVFEDGNPAFDALDQHILSSGESLLVTRGVMPLKVSIASSSPTVNATTTMHVEGFNPIDFAYEPLAGAAITGVDASTTDTNGDAVVSFTSADATTVFATATGYLQSNTITVTPVESVATASNTVQITIRDRSTIAWSGTPTLPTSTSTLQIAPTGTTTTYAIQPQSLLGVLETLASSTSAFSISDLQYYPSFGAFYVNCIAFANASSTDCGNWQYQVDGSYPWDSIDQHILHDGDRVFIYYGSPRRVSLVSSTVATNESFVATAESYDPATDTYSPAVGYTIGVTQPDPNSPWSPTEIATSTVDAQGQATFSISTAGSYGVGLQEDYYSPLTSLTVTDATATSTTTDTTGGGGGGTAGVANAFAFLISQQQASGSFNTPLITDWASLALALSDAPSSARLSAFGYQSSARPSLSGATDYERHALGLMALGINPYSGTGADYISPIVNTFDGTQIGQAQFINDDIFGILVLSKAGYSSSDAVISSTVAHIIAAQRTDGSWESSADLTAAAIQALEQFSSLPGASSAISRATSYLHSIQQSNAGFGNSDSTSWIINAIASRGDSMNSWRQNIATPVTTLASMQNQDGSFGAASASIDSRTWSTAYALTALEHRSWVSLLGSFAKPAGAPVGVSASSTILVATTTATTTIPVATSTPLIATSTLFSVLPTSTPHLLVIHPLVHAATTTSKSASTTSELQLTASVGNTPVTQSFWKSILNFFTKIGSWFSHLF